MLRDLGQDVITMYAPYADHQTQRHRVELYHNIFDVPTYFQPLDIVGGGAYGAVALFKDTRVPSDSENAVVAIKKMANVFEHKFQSRRILRELKMLRLLKHRNIVELKEIVLPPSRTQFQDIYGIFGAMQSDLGAAIISKKNELSVEHRQLILYQILSALKYMHAAHAVHRDLKPRNILVNQNCEIKIAHFELARTLDQSKNLSFTDYVAGRWYRAPELLLQSSHYNSAVDIWSVGCILAEMILGQPLLKGANTKEQFELISKQLGIPTPEQLSGQPEHLKTTLSKVMKHPKKPKIEQKLKGRATQSEIDLLKKMLSFFPQNRISAEDALKHPYLSEYSSEEQEIQPAEISELEFEFEGYDLKTEQIKDLLYEEILWYHFDNFRQTYERNIKSKGSNLQHILNNSNKDKYNPATDDEK